MYKTEHKAGVIRTNRREKQQKQEKNGKLSEEMTFQVGLKTGVIFMVVINAECLRA